MGGKIQSGMKKIYTATIVMSVITIINIIFPATRASAETLKIGFVTDWEYGYQKKHTHKFPRQAEKYLNEAVNHFNKIFQPDLVIGGGDYILGSGVKKKTVRKQLRYINQILKKATARSQY